MLSYLCPLGAGRQWKVGPPSSKKVRRSLFGRGSNGQTSVRQALCSSGTSLSREIHFFRQAILLAPEANVTLCGTPQSNDVAGGPPASFCVDGSQGLSLALNEFDKLRDRLPIDLGARRLEVKIETLGARSALAPSVLR
jgi:hypothetical protein